MVGHKLLRSLTNKLQEPVQAEVKGEIPKWLAGTMYRNGPGRFHYGDKTYAHLFDGHACVHKVKIDQGKVIYSSKFLETKSYTKSLAENRLYPVFGTADLCSTLFGRLKTAFVFSDWMDNTNVNVLPYGDRQLYALTETNYIVKLDPVSLNIEDTINISKHIRTAGTTIAHPHTFNDGSWITMGMNMSNRTQPCYEFVRYKKPSEDSKDFTEHAEVIGRFPSSHKNALSYFHSFAVTENYIVFLEQSLKFDFLAFMANAVKNKPFSDALIMKKDFGARIHIMNKNTGEVMKQKYVTDPLFVFHHINAYETTNNEIIMDVAAYDVNHFDINKMTREDMFTERLVNTPVLHSPARRITVPLGSSSLTPIHCEIKNINPRLSIELPTINYSEYNGKYYKYAYGVNLAKSPFSVVKIDVTDGEKSKEFVYDIDGKTNHLPTEPVFVPNPDCSDEDDGVLLVLVLADKNDFLSILDAKSLTEIARAELPDQVKAAFTFHGFFADEKQFPRLNV